RAFDDADAKKTAVQTQGSGIIRRLSSIATQLWSETMEKKLLLTTSALGGLLILPVAGYISWTMMHDPRMLAGDQQAPAMIGAQPPQVDEPKPVQPQPLPMVEPAAPSQPAVKQAPLARQIEALSSSKTVGQAGTAAEKPVAMAPMPAPAVEMAQD
ncbi:hypothetical protein NZA98_05365, partial [Escherichia coli]|nr:hypothetical protein [Escherichia coli]